MSPAPIALVDGLNLPSIALLDQVGQGNGAVAIPGGRTYDDPQFGGDGQLCDLLGAEFGGGAWERDPCRMVGVGVHCKSPRLVG